MKTKRERLESLNRLLDKCTVVSDAKMKEMLESGTIAVCVPVALGGFDMFPDNETGKCGVCDCEIYFRPYTAPAVNKVCFTCWMKEGRA